MRRRQETAGSRISQPARDGRHANVREKLLQRREILMSRDAGVLDKTKMAVTQGVRERMAQSKMAGPGCVRK